MTSRRVDIDCVVIGYNEMPFAEYERLLRGFGADSCAYRDLKFSFIDLDGAPQTCLDLLNRSESQARKRQGTLKEFREYRSGEVPNLAAVYLTSYLRRNGFFAEYINLFQVEKARLRLLLDDHPACVAITTTFYVTNHAASQIVKFVKQYRPEIPVVVGGPLIANHARRFSGTALHVILEDLGADVYVVESQGEMTLARIVSALNSDGKLADVPNIIYLSGGVFHHTPIIAEDNSLDANDIDWQRILTPAANPTLQTFTARGCAFQCAFCSYPQRAGGRAFASLETVVRQLDAMCDLGGVLNVAFIDDTFNVPLSRFKEFCNLLIKRRYPFRWYSYFRCSHVDDQTVELMARSGCAGVFLGLESGSPQMLSNMAKGASVEQYLNGIALLKKYDILTFGSFLFGFPGETNATVRETIDFIRKIKLDFYRIQPWYYETGTPIEKRRQEFGLVGSGFNWRHRSMSADQAINCQRDAFLEIKESCWLPQWSFDFWVIPYLIGRRIPLGAFKDFMAAVHGLLKLEFHAVKPLSKREHQDLYLERMVTAAEKWCGS